MLLLVWVLLYEQKNIERDGEIKLNSNFKSVKEEDVISNNFTRGHLDLNSEKSDRKLGKQLKELLKSRLKLLRYRSRKINRNILIVARNFQTRYLFEFILRKHGFLVTTISNVDEILDIINGNYGAILFDETDCNMEDLDIIELIKMTNPEVKLLTISRNLMSDCQKIISTSHKTVSNYRVREVSESSSKISTSVTVNEISINESA